MMDAAIGSTGSQGVAFKAMPPMVNEIFNTLKLLTEQGMLKGDLVPNSQAADPILKKITGKGFYDHVQQGLFNKHGRDRLARLVRIHSARVKENMQAQSVKFFTTLAKKITNFVNKTPLLKQVFDSVQGLTANKAQSAQFAASDKTDVSVSAKRHPTKSLH